jgi:hypothetical protein
MEGTLYKVIVDRLREKVSCECGETARFKTLTTNTRSGTVIAVINECPGCFRKSQKRAQAVFDKWFQELYP